MKRLFSLFAVLVAATVVLNGFVVTATKADSFMMKAAQSDMLEIMSSQAALQKSSNEEVRRFAQMMIDDHTRTSEELRTIAASQNVTLPTAVSSKQQSMMNKLNRAAAGMEFDREYMKMQVKAHEDAVKLFQKQANDNDEEDAVAKAFAAKNLPALQSHLTMARTMSNGMRGTGGGNSGGMNGNMNGSMNGNMNMNSNSGGMNMNSGGNMNMNSNRNMNSNGNSNRNRNNNRNTNSNGNTNSNSNMNSNVNM